MMVVGWCRFLESNLSALMCTASACACTEALFLNDNKFMGR
jgi:hypothetical protein